MKYNFLLLFALVLILSNCEQKQQRDLTLAALFSDHMVLQQNSEVPIWGTCTAGETITITASWGEDSSCKADEKGQWNCLLSTPVAGGPYSIEIKVADQTKLIGDVLCGEVWLASGQSNMQMPVKGWPPNDPIQNSEEEIKSGDYPGIRMFTVERSLSVSPIDSVKGEWIPASPQTVGDFSATAYFFARRLHMELNVPIGILHSSWGGTVAEAWTSEQKLKTLGDFDDDILKLDNPDLLKETKRWFGQFSTMAIPQDEAQWNSISFEDEKLVNPDFDDNTWQEIELPGHFDQNGSGEFDGAVILRKVFTVDDPTKEYKVHIEAVDDMDATYINGTKVGGLAGFGFWNVPREFEIPKALLKKGKNLIAIRAIDTGGPGSVSAPISISDKDGNTISLEGIWKRQMVSEMYNSQFYVYPANTDFSNRPELFQIHQNLPTVLFNAMIHPLIPFKIKGAIWYQGESNVGRAAQYQRLFPAMITDWRERWQDGFAFYYSQIAPYNYIRSEGKHESAKLRDAQRLSLKTPNTGMAVTLDIGNPVNIHPANKQDVGKRLAGLALSGTYGVDLIASGPLFKNSSSAGNKMLVEFDHTGSGLMSSDKGLFGFELAGLDKIFKEAKAKIAGEMVEVSHPNITKPAYVRYAWWDASEASLFNKEGLPASSFNTAYE